MSKSHFVEGLDAVQAEVHSVLKPLGFQKKGRTHNRLTIGGLTHVINFQRDKWVEERIMFPWIWKKSYGKFAINIGVLLPCVYQAECQTSPPPFVQDYECTIRQRLGRLAFDRDEWFTVTDDGTGLAKSLIDLLHRFGFDFLNQFQTYENVLLHYRKHDKLPDQNSGRASLEAAIISHHLGDAVSARSLLQKAYATNHKGFQGHVAEIADRLGITLA